MGLPPTSQEPVPENSGAVRTAGVDARARIVAFDDDAYASAALTLMIHFRWPEVPVLTFNRAKEALREIERRPPDLFTTDINHPGMPTTEILQRLARQKVKFPVFIISAMDMFAPRMVQQFVQQGLKIEFLSKPFLADDLWNLVAKYLGLPMKPVPKECPRPRLP
jgi:DNA-binding NtrC family response regulator